MFFSAFLFYSFFFCCDIGAIEFKYKNKMISYTGQHIAQINGGTGMKGHSEYSAEAGAEED